MSIARGQYTVSIAAQGLQGPQGNDGYTIVLTNENYTFAATASNALSDSTETQVLAYQGTKQLEVSVGEITGLISGMTATVNKNTITFSVSSSVTNLDSGLVTIPIIIDGQRFTRTFSYSFAKAGESGKPVYTWIKYADTPTSGMSDSPTGKNYIGLAYNKESPVESTKYSDYAWSLIRGDIGPAGPPGESGTPLYTWIKYGDNEYGDGISDDPEGKSYIGLSYNNPDPTESDDPSLYTWSLILGPAGPAGRTYMLEIPTPIIKKGADDSLTPASITFRSYYRDGISATRTAYNGFFQIDYLREGTNNYVNKYFSETATSSLVWRINETNISSIRCTLYAEDKLTVIDTQTIPVLTDAENMATFRIETNYNDISCYALNGIYSISPPYLKIEAFQRLGNEEQSILPYLTEGEDYYLDPSINSDLTTSTSDDNTEIWTSLAFLQDVPSQDPVAEGEIGKNLLYSSDGVYYIDLNGILNYQPTAYTDPKLSKLSTLLKNVSETVFIKILLKKSNVIFATSLVRIRNGIDESGSQLLDKSENINNAVDAGVTFSREGLTVKNGVIQIFTNVLENDEEGSTSVKEERVFYTDENGNLNIKGIISADGGYFSGELKAATGSFSGNLEAATGSFSGTLVAASGSFEGEVKADSGSIGGIVISDSSLYSSNNNFILNSDGSVIAENITLGNFAKINSYLELQAEDSQNGKGQVRIWNPNNPESNGKFIESSNFIINSDGTGSIGNIQLNGVNSTITSDDSFNPNWAISTDKAIFNNIVAKGKITASVFDSLTSKVSGGVFVFKNGAVVKKCESTYIILENKEDISSFSPGDVILISTESVSSNLNNSDLIVKVTDIDKENSKVTFTIITGSFDSTLGYYYAINLGSEDSNGNINDWVIGINSTQNPATTFSLPPNSLSFKSVEKENNTYSFKDKIILGQLKSGSSSLPDYVTDTYGLYASSAFLNGTLVTNYTSDGSQLYAGVNTLSNTKLTVDYESDPDSRDESPIIFWAGSNGISSSDIQEAPFQVSSNGFLYARKGYFTGSVLVRAKIEAAELVAAKITGKEESPSLTLEGKNSSILFQEQVNGVDKEIMELSSSNGITFNKEGPCLNINNSSGQTLSIDSDGNLLANTVRISSPTEDTGLRIANSRIEYYRHSSETGEIIGAQTLFEQSALNIQFSSTNSARFTSGLTRFYTTSTQIDENLILGRQEEIHLVYRKAYNEENIIGYDIYVE